MSDTDKAEPVTAERVIGSFVDSTVVLYRQIRDLKTTIEHQGWLLSCISAVLDGEEPPSFGNTHTVIGRVYKLRDSYDAVMDDLRKLVEMTPDEKLRAHILSVIAREESRG